MKMNANLIRPGNVLNHEGKLWSVLKIQLIQPGKGLHEEGSCEQGPDQNRRRRLPRRREIGARHESAA